MNQEDQKLLANWSAKKLKKLHWIAERRQAVRDDTAPILMRAAVVIGLDNAAGLLGLSDAVGAAKRFATWATKERFDSVELLTDAGDTTVRLDDILAAVTQAVKDECDQLVIYFSGHGFLRGSEIWVLSNGTTNANEAVDLGGSIEFARDSGIAHVIFISDACRSLPANIRVSRIQGGVIFPLSNPAPPPRASIDLFYATLPGDVALEVKDIDAVDGHKAVFTSCLLEGLKGELPSCARSARTTAT